MWWTTSYRLNRRPQSPVQLTSSSHSSNFEYSSGGEFNWIQSRQITWLQLRTGFPTMNLHRNHTYMNENWLQDAFTGPVENVNPFALSAKVAPLSSLDHALTCWSFDVLMTALFVQASALTTTGFYFSEWRPNSSRVFFPLVPFIVGGVQIRKDCMTAHSSVIS